MLSAVFFSIVLYVPQLMEKVLGFSRARRRASGCCRCSACSRSSPSSPGALYERLGGRAGDHRRHRPARRRARCVLSFFGADSGYAALVPGLALTGIGAGLFYPSITTAAVTMLDAAPLQPRRRDHLHVPDRRRRDRARALTTALFTSRSEDEVGPTRPSAAGLQHDRRAGRRHPRRARRHRARARRPSTQFGASVADKVLDGRQGLVRRRRPAQPAGGRGDRPGRAW